MANNAPLVFTEFTDPTILFASLDAANSFFGECGIAASTTTVYGAVKQATLPANLTTALNNTYVNVTVLNGDGSQSLFKVPDRTSYDALCVQVSSLQTVLNTLLTNLRSAGIGV